MARYAKIANGVVENVVECEVDFAVEHGLISLDGHEEIGIGDLYQNNLFSKADRTDEKWSRVRKERIRLLEESDLFVMPDRWSALSSDKQAALTVYRQTLRDIPQNYTNPDAVKWPEDWNK